MPRAESRTNNGQARGENELLQIAKEKNPDQGSYIEDYFRQSRVASFLFQTFEMACFGIII
jgi:hypothetical protein